MLLLVDHRSAHGIDLTTSQIFNVTVKSLPPHTTSKTRELDAGIIISVKFCCRAFQLKQAVVLIKKELGTI